MTSPCVPSLQEAFKQHPEALKALPETTRDRYRAGYIPKSIIWLLRHPDLLRTLAEIAEKCPETVDIPS